MSAVVKTLTPFLDAAILCKALDSLDVKYHMQGSNIVTERIDFYGNQIFVWNGSRFLFQHDSSASSPYYGWRNKNMKEWKQVTEFLKILDVKYREKFAEHMEELERQRLEEERKRYIEDQRCRIIESAKARGYSIKETKRDGKIQIILVRTI